MFLVEIHLASVVDWPAFSCAVRVLRDEGVTPDRVRWRVAGEDDGVADLFEDAATFVRHADELASAAAMRLPRSFVDAAREVFLHAGPHRLPLIHRLALRIADDPRAWDDPLHEDRLQFDRMQREVKREIHKMHAFVRFRRLAEPMPMGVDDPIASRPLVARGGAGADSTPGEDDGVDDNGGARFAALRKQEHEREQGHEHEHEGKVGIAASLDTVRHVAWFEPAHHVLEAAAPFFARRFATMRWAILTPRASVEWNGDRLVFGPGARREDAPAADAGEALWLAYYRSIFNPARVKVAMMKKEMPVRFWKNLPEAAAVSELLAQAPERARRMVDAGGVARTRRRGQWTGGDPAADGVVAGSLADLARLAARCRDCPGADAATQTVFGEGGAQARVMVVGEQPGDQEDLRGKPFQGPAGQLLRAAFAELGWPADALYLTNAVKHFHHELRGKRRIHKTPGQQEALACLHWLEQEVDALAPRAIVALGATAVRSLLGPGVAVRENEGRWLPRADGIPVLVCLHPAAILRAEPARQSAMRARWVDCLRAASPLVLEDVSTDAVVELRNAAEAAT